MKDEVKQALEKVANMEGYTLTFDDVNKGMKATPRQNQSNATDGLEAVVKEVGGVEKFAELITSLKDLPSQMSILSESVKNISTGVQDATTLAKNVAIANEAKKNEVIARLVLNGKNPFGEDKLKGFDLETLQQLEQSYAVTNYEALGSGVSIANLKDDEVLETPSLFESALAVEA